MSTALALKGQGEGGSDQNLDRVAVYRRLLDENHHLFRREGTYIKSWIHFPPLLSSSGASELN